MRSETRSWSALAGFLVCALAAGGLGAIATARSVDTWYRQIDRPAWTPPDSWFGPVWTTLYVLMAGAAWLVWRRRDEQSTTRALALWWAQLVVNASWSWVFFGAHALGASVVVIAALWLLIVATIGAFFAVRPLAAALLAPYLAWVTFAGALNVAIWRLN